MQSRSLDSQGVPPNPCPGSKEATGLWTCAGKPQGGIDWDSADPGLSKAHG